jgi:diacylglycerol kinase family enzyme
VRDAPSPTRRLELKLRSGTLFLNPSSGLRPPSAEVSALEAAAAESGLEVIHLTRDLNVAAIIREQMDQGRKLFVAAGGDGTINAVIQPLVHSEAALAVIPVGTYNHFARDLGLPFDWRAALEVALSGSIRQVDAGRVNDRFFVNNVLMGLYPELVARREEHGRDYPRWKARLFAVYVTLRKYPHVAVTVESEHHQEVIRTHVFMVSNNSYDLSRIGIDAPRSTLEEGRLSVYWLPHVRRLVLTRLIGQYLTGRVTNTPGFRSFRTSRVKVQSSRSHLHLGIDGEVSILTPPLVITIVPRSLLVKVPRGG